MTSITKKLILVVFIIVAVSAIFLNYGQISRLFFKPPSAADPKVTEEKEKSNFEIIAQNLQIPWEIAFLPDGDLLVTERPGTLKRIGEHGRNFNIEGIKHIEEGGLLGMTLHPQFTENRWIYIYLTTETKQGLKNRVERYRLDQDFLREKKNIVDNIPGAKYHDGGRIAFGPDGNLYVTTGDANNPKSAQDLNSLAGKILRLKDDGSVPADNPFGNAIWSYGHRNPQGLVWDDKGRLWATKHGRSGLLSGLDELNQIEKGANYGWPAIQGDERRPGMHSPVIQSGPDHTWAPSGAVYFNDSIYFTGLRGESIYQTKISGDGTASQPVVHLTGEFGRIRSIKINNAGFFYVVTSNTDGRGEVRPGDDKIIKLSPSTFK